MTKSVWTKENGGEKAAIPEKSNVNAGAPPSTGRSEKMKAVRSQENRRPSRI